MRATLRYCLTILSLTAVLGCNPPASTPSSSGTTAEPAAAGPDVATDADQATDAESPAVAVSLIDYAGLQEHIEGLKGQVVVVDIWSNSCIPCIQEFHNLVELSRKYPERVACVSMNVDYIGIKSKPPESYLPTVQAFLEKEQAVTVTNFATSEPDSDILEKYDVESMPAIIIYDAQGQIVHKLTDANSGDDGLSYAEDVLPKLEALLAAP